MTPAFDLTRYQDPLTIQRVLHTAKTVAIVGLSGNRLRASYFGAIEIRCPVWLLFLFRSSPYPGRASTPTPFQRDFRVSHPTHQGI